MMRAARTTAQRQRQGDRGNVLAEASAADAGGRGDAASTTVTVHVALAFHQRRGRKVLVAPDGAGQGALRAPLPPTRTRHEATPAVRALARAFRWRRLLETGAVGTVHEIATAEHINASYVSRVLRLTLLAPEIIDTVVAALDLGGAAELDRLMLPFPVEWSRHPSFSN